MIGSVDAALVWDATVRQNPRLEAVELPVFADVYAVVAVGVLTLSKQPAERAALRAIISPTATKGGRSFSRTAMILLMKRGSRGRSTSGTSHAGRLALLSGAFDPRRRLPAADRGHADGRRFLFVAFSYLESPWRSGCSLFRLAEPAFLFDHRHCVGLGAVPLGYVLSRFAFPGRSLIAVLMDVPIVLPPLVVGLSLLILFQTPPGRFINSIITVTYAIPSVILAQFAVACAFAVRTMRGTFDQIPRRRNRWP